nr:MAG TPA: hypothetical protein [Caudoviricetes sp.]
MLSTILLLFYKNIFEILVFSIDIISKIAYNIFIIIMGD